MSQQITMDSKRVLSVIAEIVEDVSTIAASATHFRMEVQNEAGRSNAAFLEALSKGVSSLEQNINQTKTIFLEIEESVESYVRQFAAFDNDTEGI